MRYSLCMMILLSATPAFAQSYPQYQYQPQQEAAVTTYPQVPTSYPQQPVYAPQPVQSQPAPQVYYEARPTDAGQSVVTDVRQMNF